MVFLVVVKFKQTFQPIPGAAGGCGGRVIVERIALSISCFGTSFRAHAASANTTPLSTF